MKVEICCQKLLEQWEEGELYVGENGQLYWDTIREDIRYCPFCGEPLENEIVVKNKVKE